MKLAARLYVPALSSIALVSCSFRGQHRELIPDAALDNNASRHASLASDKDNRTESQKAADNQESLVSGERDDFESDALTWKLGKPPALHGTAPPNCPLDIAWNAQYWYNTQYVDKWHTICKYADDCQRIVSNQERLTSIRNVLKITKATLDAAGVSYALYGGTAIGQARCQDVLAWDNDCDVVVERTDLPKLDAKFVPAGYELMPFTVVIPYKVVDKSTGFYCDIFQMDAKTEQHRVSIPWPYASETCAQFPDTPQSPGDYQHCFKHNYHDIYPFAPCVVDGVTHTCAKNQDAFLADTYGTGWRTPNVTTST